MSRGSRYCSRTTRSKVQLLIQQNNTVNNAHDSQRESREKLLSDVNELQKQILQLNSDMEKAKRSLAEVLKKIEAEHVADNSTDKLAKVNGRPE